MKTDPSPPLTAPDLVDLSSVHIDRSKPTKDRLRELTGALGNPYQFRVGDVAVHVRFDPKGKTFQDIITDLLTS